MLNSELIYRKSFSLDSSSFKFCPHGSIDACNITMPYNFLISRDFSVKKLNGHSHSGGSRNSNFGPSQHSFASQSALISAKQTHFENFCCTLSHYILKVGSPGIIIKVNQHFITKTKACLQRDGSRRVNDFLRLQLTQQIT